MKGALIAAGEALGLILIVCGCFALPYILVSLLPGAAP
jgi:hypothetical protein